MHVRRQRFSDFRTVLFERVLAPVRGWTALRGFSFFLLSNVKRLIFSLRHRVGGRRPTLRAPPAAAPGRSAGPRIDSFNGKLRDEMLDREIFYTLGEAEILIER
jgi:hypothetical protein